MAMSDKLMHFTLRDPPRLENDRNHAKLAEQVSKYLKSGNHIEEVEIGKVNEPLLYGSSRGWSGRKFVYHTPK
jgi:hypothetical protein